MSTERRTSTPPVPKAGRRLTEAAVSRREPIHVLGEIGLFSLVWWWSILGRFLLVRDFMWLRPSLLFIDLMYWWLWVLVVWPFSILVRRLPIERPHRLRRALLYAALGPLPAAVHGVLQFLVVHPFPDLSPRRLDMSVTFDLVYGQGVYWALLALKHVSHYYRRNREAEIGAAQLEEQLTRARVDAMRTAIRPDFVVARLRDIAARLRRDPQSADDRVVRLGRYLRRRLESAAGPEPAPERATWSPPASSVAVARRESWFDWRAEILLLVTWNILSSGAVLGSTYVTITPRIPLAKIVEAGASMWILGTLWAIACLPLGAVIERFPIEFPHRRRRLICYAGFGLIVGAGHASLRFALAHTLMRGSDIYVACSFPCVLTQDLSTGQITYGFFLWVKHVWYFRRRYGAELARAAGLRAQLATAQLTALQMQLQPHFLFNTLHSIAELAHEDAGTAEQMTLGLADYLQRAFDAGREQMVTLTHELALLDHYLRIQKMRFQDRLTIEIEAKPDVRSLLVPSFILQPLVENAIKHGIARQLGGGSVRVRCARDGGTLAIEITNDGPDGRRPAPVPPTGPRGLGLRNTESRLRQLYGRRYDFHLRRNEGGATTFVAIPAMEASPSSG